MHRVSGTMSIFSKVVFFSYFTTGGLDQQIRNKIESETNMLLVMYVGWLSKPQHPKINKKSGSTIPNAP